MSEDKYKDSFGCKLREARVLAHLSLRELATRLGMPLVDLSAIEMGRLDASGPIQATLSRHVADALYLHLNDAPFVERTIEKDSEATFKSMAHDPELAKEGECVCNSCEYIRTGDECGEG